MEKHKLGLIVRYIIDQSLASHVQITDDFEVDLCVKVGESGMEQYRAMHPDGGERISGNRTRFEFLIVVGVEADSRKDAEAKAIKLLLQIERAETPEGIAAVRTEISTIISN